MHAESIRAREDSRYSDYHRQNALLALRPLELLNPRKPNRGNYLLENQESVEMPKGLGLDQMNWAMSQLSTAPNPMA
jgi:hypothetical protein